MKIAHVVCTFPPYKGGTGNAAYNFAKELSNQGNEITVFTPRYQNLPLADNEKFKIIRLKPLVKLGNAAVMPQLYWSLRNFDLIHLHYPFFGSAEIILLLKLIKRKKINLALHYHMDNSGHGLKGMIYALYRRLVLPLLAKKSLFITCASLDYIKNSFLKSYYQKHPEKFQETYFGVDSEKFKPRPEIKKNNKKNILFVGGLDKSYHDKGLDVLLKAVSVLKSKGANNVNLIIVGNGNQKKYYRELAEQLQLEEQVEFTKNVSDEQLINYCNLSDVLVLPSKNRGEAFGLVLLEALSSGKPVIASNLPGVRSVFENGRQGLLVKPNDASELAKKLEIIITNEQLAQEMGRQGRTLVLERYRWDKIGQRLNQIYIKFISQIKDN